MKRAYLALSFASIMSAFACTPESDPPVHNLDIHKEATEAAEQIGANRSVIYCVRGSDTCTVARAAWAPSHKDDADCKSGYAAGDVYDVNKNNLPLLNFSTAAFRSRENKRIESNQEDISDCRQKSDPAPSNLLQSLAIRAAVQLDNDQPIIICAEGFKYCGIAILTRWPLPDPQGNDACTRYADIYALSVDKENVPLNLSETMLKDLEKRHLTYGLQFARPCMSG